MPNHITNRLTIMGETNEIEKCLSEIKGRGNQHIDFNTFAPMPNELEGTKSPMDIISQKEYDEQEARIAKGELTEIEKLHGVSRCLTEELSKEYKVKFGADNWYDWNTINWGTKWNAYQQISLGGIIEFFTAWSTPYIAIQKLSEKYPYLQFNVKFADEDFGQNVGEYTFSGGVCIEENIPDEGSLEAMRMAMDIIGDADYFLIDYLCEECGDELNEFDEMLVCLAHEKGYLVDDYSTPVLNKLKELALEVEQYERVAEIDKLLKSKEIVG